MQLKLDSIARKVIEVSFYALFFLTPLLWSPANSELFELPKMFFVWAITIIITGTWLIRIINRKSLIFNRTSLDLPLLLFLLSQIVSYYFSIDRHISLWGYYSRFNGGLLSIISYCILYWAFVSNMDFKKTLHSTYYLLLSTFLVALYAIPAHFGYDPTCLVLGRGFTTNCWSAQFVPTERIFGTLGQPNWLAAYLVALAPLSWALLLNLKLIGKWKMENGKFIFYSLISILFLLAIYYTRSDSGFIGLGAAALVFALGYFAIKKKVKLKMPVVIGIIGAILIGGIFALPKVPQANRCLSIMFSPNSPIAQEPTSLITPSADIRCIVWKGAIEIWKHYPIIGSGPETFAHTYYNFKPAEHNLTSEWDHLYNKAHNEFLNYAANTGTLGLGTYLLLIISTTIMFKNLVIKNSLKIENYKLKIFALAAGWTSILVTNFFGFSVVPVQLLFFLLPALAFTLTQSETPRSTPSALSKRQILLLLAVLTSTFYILNSTFRFYTADLNFASAQKKNSNSDYLASLTQIRMAIEKAPNEPVYQNALSDIASSIALLAYDQDPPARLDSAKRVGEASATLSAQFAALAESASDRALATSPRNISTLKIRSSIFITLAQLDPVYLEKARESLEKAHELAPNDARIAFNLGLLYWQTDQNEKAKSQFEKALALRPNYSDAQEALEELK